MTNLKDALCKRKEQGSFRALEDLTGLVDFCSNDYLGFAQSTELGNRIRNAYEESELLLGATGARLISGNSPLAEELENEIAEFHGASAGLIFNSGYDGNLGIFSAIPTRHDTVIFDELIHASVRDGIRLGNAKSYSFRHNRLDDLEKKLKVSKGQIFVAVESLYSMDGDFAPLKELVSLSKQHGFHLIVDEAHATGLYGEKGEGKVFEMGLQQDVFARLHTFGKAIGLHGAIVLGSNELRDYLINFARSFIYSTALPPQSLLAVREAYRYLPAAGEIRKKLFANIQKFRSNNSCLTIQSDNKSPIQAVIMSGNDKAQAASQRLKEKKLAVRAVLSPTVPKGSERLRVCIHAFNSVKDLEALSIS